MCRWWPAVRIAVFGFALASSSAATLAAEPLVLFLLKMMRDQAISSSIEAGVEAARARKPGEEGAFAASPPPTAPPLATKGQWLKGLIDDSFVHLSPAQREELYASLLKILNDPKYAAVRPTIIAEFTSQAIAIRDSYRKLSRLSESDMKAIAIEARREYERLPSEQRQQMLQVLQLGIPGIPRTLNELMLVEFSSVPTMR